MAIHVEIEGYDSLEQIGVGGMAAVYKARRVSIDKTVAVKVLFPYLAKDTSFIDRFQREAKAAARIQHENIVNVIDFGESGGSYFIVMEYYDGETLDDTLQNRRSIPVDVAIQLVLEVCYGLESAHAQDIVHRDIKPGNIIYTRQGGIKIADFGLAKKSDSMTMITQHGKVIGTPAYMSPEQAAGRPVGPQSDIFSLGVVAYELLGQQKPFEGRSYSEVLEKIQTHDPAAIATVNPLIPPEIARVVAGMLIKDEDRRYQAIGDVIADIEKAMEKLQISRDRRSLSSYVQDPETHERKFREKTIAACLSQGSYYMQKGHTHLDDAALEFRKILHLDPDNVRARKNLDRIKKERGDKDRTVTIEPTPVPRDPRPDASAPKVRRAKARPRWWVVAPVALACLALTVFTMRDRLLPVRDNAAPKLSAPSQLSVAAGATVAFSLQAADAEGDSVHFRAEGLPGGAEISRAGHFTWQVAEDQVGPHRITFVADDGTNTSRVATQIDVGRASATLAFDAIGRLDVTAGRTVRRELRATSDAGRQVTYRLVEGPPGMQIKGDEIVWRPATNAAGAHYATVEANDGYTSEQREVVVNVTAPPVAHKPANETTQSASMQPEIIVPVAEPEPQYGLLSVYFLGGVGEFSVDGNLFGHQPPFSRVPMRTGQYLVSCRMQNEDRRHDLTIVVEAGKETTIEFEVGSNPVVSVEN